MQGRNFDYGHQMSDSKEGQMAKRALLTMAKDLYDLYVTLNDHDDLPEWCHYKLATSRKDLSDITDYLTSKVMKYCLDNEIGPNDLRLEIKKSMIDSLLSENNLNEFFFGKKNKGPSDNTSRRFDREFLPKSAAMSDFRQGYQNETVHFITTAKEIARRLNSYKSSNLSLDMIDYFKKNKLAEINLTLIRDHILSLRQSINDLQPKITSAKKITPKKKSLFSRIFSTNENISKEEQSNIESLINRCMSFMTNEKRHLNRDLRQIIDLKEKSSIAVLNSQLDAIYSIISSYLEDRVNKDYTIKQIKER